MVSVMAAFAKAILQGDNALTPAQRMRLEQAQWVRQAFDATIPLLQKSGLAREEKVKMVGEHG